MLGILRYIFGIIMPIVGERLLAQSDRRFLNEQKDVNKDVEVRGKACLSGLILMFHWMSKDKLHYR